MNITTRSCSGLGNGMLDGIGQTSVADGVDPCRGALIQSFTVSHVIVPIPYRPLGQQFREREAG